MWKARTRLLAELETVRALAPPPREALLHQYLKKVYEVGSSWDMDDDRVFDWLQGHAEAHFHHKVKKDDPFRFIIEATAGNHVSAKMKLKYATALRLAFDRKLKVKEIVKFLEEGHGFNAVIKRFSGARAKKRR